MPVRWALFFCVFFCGMSSLHADHQIQLAAAPQLSADGSSMLIVYHGDIWRVATSGGRATRLTFHPASDSQPCISPDGKSIAFVSDRAGSRQVFTMNANGAAPTQLTYHTEGYSLQGWYPDGQHLLVLGTRDHFWRNASRLLKISATERSPEELLFNDYAAEGKVGPDGTRVLFVREGEREWRKGYVGSRSAQIWMWKSSTGKFTQLLNVDAGCRHPVWKPDGSGFYYCSSQGSENGARNLWEYRFDNKASVQLTQFEDDLVMSPAISADGATLVFRHLFDVYRMSTTERSQPQKIEISVATDDLPTDTHHRTLKTVSDATFSADGLEIAFTSGGDLWVMETELAEPVQITSTPEFETDPVFVDDGKAIVFVGWQSGQPDIWKVERADQSRYWWQNSDFTMSQITDDPATESRLQLSPNGRDLAYVRERGDVWLHNLDSGEETRLIESFDAPDYDFSPDGKWIVYALTDDNFNSDIWICPVDQSSEPVNISRHPDDDSRPKWSSDGKLIAFTGRRSENEVDMYYVWLSEEDEDTGSRDRKLKKALEALEKSRKKKDKPAAASKKENASSAKEPAASSPQDDANAKDEPDADVADSEKADKEQTDEKKLPDVRIDFDGIHRRLKRISLPNSTERVLGWSPDGKKLVFSGTVSNESGTWSITFPDELTPKKITSSTGTVKGWLKSPDRILWVSDGLPVTQPMSGTAKKHSFTSRQTISKSARRKAGFEAAWRVMRDYWYDDNYGNHNWDQIRRKYTDAARSAVNSAAFAQIVHLMLGELNGSHLGFYPSGDLNPQLSGGDEWRPVTVHLGVRFDARHKGPGLRIKDVIPRGPAADENSRLAAKETILSIDGTAVDPDMDLTTVLNGPSDRDIVLRVKAAGRKGAERTVVLRPTTYARVRSGLYQKWQDDNRAAIHRKAPNLGYLHIQGMNWSSFLEFERELYDVGYGMDGLIIDVRDNGGGSTTDHLLTALTQPEHAITVPRGGGPGYPQSRRVYATWNKPIVVMCNQNSYSNAEIFSHAIKNLNRGKLVGVPTAGGVISTGATRVMDVGTLRLPFRGWFLKNTGEDMELHGAVPDVVVWPRPGEIPNGRDRQLNKAIQVLTQEVRKWKSQKSPVLKRATQRNQKE